MQAGHGKDPNVHSDDCGAVVATFGVDPARPMIDENAFGLLIAYLNIEDDEYDGEREQFVTRYTGYSDLLRARLLAQPPSDSARAVELGHAFYVELIEGDNKCDPIAWLRTTRTELSESGYLTAGILTYGSSWYDGAESHSALCDIGTTKLVTASGPSEPLRRALCADAASRGDEITGTPGWGPGLYLDVDAVEALGRKPKNQPTILRCNGAEFFRAGA